MSKFFIDPSNMVRYYLENYTKESDLIYDLQEVFNYGFYNDMTDGIVRCIEDDYYLNRKKKKK